MNLLLEWAFVLVIIVFGGTFIILIRLLGNITGLEINSFGGVISLVYNPLNWLKLYSQFFKITKVPNSTNIKYRRVLILNLLAVCGMALLLALLVK